MKEEIARKSDSFQLLASTLSTTFHRKGRWKNETAGPRVENVKNRLRVRTDHCNVYGLVDHFRKWSRRSFLTASVLLGTDTNGCYSIFCFPGFSATILTRYSNGVELSRITSLVGQYLNKSFSIRWEWEEQFPGLLGLQTWPKWLPFLGIPKRPSNQRAASNFFLTSTQRFVTRLRLLRKKHSNVRVKASEKDFWL